MALSRLRVAKQYDDESVAAFCERLTHLYSTAFPSQTGHSDQKNQFLCMQLIDGIKREIYDKVPQIYGIKDFAELRDVLILAESHGNRYSYSSNKRRAVGPTDPDGDSNLSGRKQVSFRSPARVNTVISQEEDPPVTAKFVREAIKAEHADVAATFSNLMESCEQTKQECDRRYIETMNAINSIPVESQVSRGPPPNCYKCGQIGHYKRDCPDIFVPRPKSRGGQSFNAKLPPYNNNVITSSPSLPKLPHSHVLRYLDEPDSESEYESNYVPSYVNMVISAPKASAKTPHNTLVKVQAEKPSQVTTKVAKPVTPAAKHALATQYAPKNQGANDKVATNSASVSQNTRSKSGSQTDTTSSGQSSGQKYFTASTGESPPPNKRSKGTPESSSSSSDKRSWFRGRKKAVRKDTKFTLLPSEDMAINEIPDQSPTWHFRLYSQFVRSAGGILLTLGMGILLYAIAVTVIHLHYTPKPIFVTGPPVELRRLTRAVSTESVPESHHSFREKGASLLRALTDPKRYLREAIRKRLLHSYPITIVKDEIQTIGKDIEQMINAAPRNSGILQCFVHLVYKSIQYFTISPVIPNVNADYLAGISRAMDKIHLLAISYMNRSQLALPASTQTVALEPAGLRRVPRQVSAFSTPVAEDLEIARSKLFPEGRRFMHTYLAEHISIINTLYNYRQKYQYLIATPEEKNFTNTLMQFRIFLSQWYRELNDTIGHKHLLPKHIMNLTGWHHPAALHLQQRLLTALRVEDFPQILENFRKYNQYGFTIVEQLKSIMERHSNSYPKKGDDLIQAFIQTSLSYIQHWSYMLSQNLTLETPQFFPGRYLLRNAHRSYSQSAPQAASTSVSNSASPLSSPISFITQSSPVQRTKRAIRGLLSAFRTILRTSARAAVAATRATARAASTVAKKARRISSSTLKKAAVKTAKVLIKNLPRKAIKAAPKLTYKMFLSPSRKITKFFRNFRRINRHPKYAEEAFSTSVEAAGKILEVGLTAGIPISTLLLAKEYLATHNLPQHPLAQMLDNVTLTNETLTNITEIQNVIEDTIQYPGEFAYNIFKEAGYSDNETLSFISEIYEWAKPIAEAKTEKPMPTLAPLPLSFGESQKKKKNIAKSRQRRFKDLAFSKPQTVAEMLGVQTFMESTNETESLLENDVDNSTSVEDDVVLTSHHDPEKMYTKKGRLPNSRYEPSRRFGIMPSRPYTANFSDPYTPQPPRYSRATRTSGSSYSPSVSHLDPVEYAKTQGLNLISLEEIRQQLHTHAAVANTQLGAAATPEGLALLTSKKVYIPMVAHLAAPQWLPSANHSGDWRDACRTDNAPETVSWDACQRLLDPDAAKRDCRLDVDLKREVYNLGRDFKRAYSGSLGTKYYVGLLANLCAIQPAVCGLRRSDSPTRKRRLVKRGVFGTIKKSPGTLSVGGSNIELRNMASHSRSVSSLDSVGTVYAQPDTVRHRGTVHGPPSGAAPEIPPRQYRRPSVRSDSMSNIYENSRPNSRWSRVKTGYKTAKPTLSKIGTAAVFFGIATNTILGGTAVNRANQALETVDRLGKAVSQNIGRLNVVTDGVVSLRKSGENTIAYAQKSLTHLYTAIEKVRCQGDIDTDMLEFHTTVGLYRSFAEDAMHAILQAGITGKLSPRLLDIPELYKTLGEIPEMKNSIMRREPTLVYRFAKVYPVKMDYDTLTFGYILEIPNPHDREIFPIYQVHNLGILQYEGPPDESPLDVNKYHVYKVPLPQYAVRRRQGDYIPINIHRCQASTALYHCAVDAVEADSARMNCMTTLMTGICEANSESKDKEKKAKDKELCEIFHKCLSNLYPATQDRNNPRIQHTPAGVLVRAFPYPVTVFTGDPSAIGGQHGHELPLAPHGSYWIPNQNTSAFKVRNSLYSVQQKTHQYVRVYRPVALNIVRPSDRKFVQSARQFANPGDWQVSKDLSGLKPLDEYRPQGRPHRRTWWTVMITILVIAFLLLLCCCWFWLCGRCPSWCRFWESFCLHVHSCCDLVYRQGVVPVYDPNNPNPEYRYPPDEDQYPITLTPVLNRDESTSFRRFQFNEFYHWFKHGVSRLNSRAPDGGIEIQSLQAIPASDSAESVELFSGTSSGVQYRSRTPKAITFGSSESQGQLLPATSSSTLSTPRHYHVNMVFAPTLSPPRTHGSLVNATTNQETQYRRTIEGDPGELGISLGIHVHKITMMPDTGSDISFMTADMARRLGGHMYPIHDRRANPSKAVGGGTIQFQGYLICNLFLYQHAYPHRFLVLTQACSEGLPYDVLVGNDLLQDIGTMTLCYESRKVTFRDHHRHVIHKYDMPPDIVPLVLTAGGDDAWQLGLAANADPERRSYERPQPQVRGRGGDLDHPLLNRNSNTPGMRPRTSSMSSIFSTQSRDLDTSASRRVLQRPGHMIPRRTTRSNAPSTSANEALDHIDIEFTMDPPETSSARAAEPAQNASVSALGNRLGNTLNLNGPQRDSRARARAIATEVRGKENVPPGGVRKGINPPAGAFTPGPVRKNIAGKEARNLSLQARRTRSQTKPTSSVQTVLTMNSALQEIEPEHWEEYVDSAQAQEAYLEDTEYDAMNAVLEEDSESELSEPETPYLVNTIISRNTRKNRTAIAPSIVKMQYCSRTHRPIMSLFRDMPKFKRPQGPLYCWSNMIVGIAPQEDNITLALQASGSRADLQNELDTISGPSGECIVHGNLGETPEAVSYVPEHLTKNLRDAGGNIENLVIPQVKITLSDPNEDEPKDTVGTDDALPIYDVSQLPSDIQERLKSYNVTEETLSHTQRLALLEVLEAYDGAFSKGPYDLGCYQHYKHHIDTGDRKLGYVAPRKMAERDKPGLKNELDELVKLGVIQISRSPWACPIVLVPKTDGTKRLCIDYKRLNLIAETCAFPLPRIENILGALEGMKYFSTLDVSKGF
jgi:hypothetical protein